jgi:hypothetical protein
VWGGISAISIEVLKSGLERTKEEVVAMGIERRILGISGLFLWLVMISACSASAQTPQKTIHSPDGWVVKYGVVDGATTQPAAMVSVLRSVAKSSGESPKIGPPFRYKGTNTVGVFYVVRDHSAGNVPVLGLILSDFNDKKQVETALMYDTASRFPNTLKSMMETVFKEWRPGGVKSAANTQPGKPTSSSGSSASTGSVPGGLLPMHPVTLQDNSASAKIPDGWQLGPMSNGGTMQILGPHQECILLNGVVRAIDPRSVGYQNDVRMHLQMPGIKVVMPYNTDLSRAFPNLYITSAHVLNWNPTDLQIEHTEIVTIPDGKQCEQGRGHVNNFGNGPMELNAMFCSEAPTDPQSGLYLIYVYFSLVPNSLADQERLTAATVMASFRWNEAMIRQQAANMAAPVIARMQGIYQDHMHALQQFTQSQIDRTHQIGQQVTDRIAESDRQQAIRNQDFNQHEEDISRYGQGFSNYILDQNVIEYSNSYGDVVHETVPNSIAYNLVQHHPDKVEIVPTPNYIPVIDFSK